MADKKISQLTGATTPLAGTEVLPIVQSGSTVKVSVDNLTAGKTVSATKFIPTGGDATGNGVYLPAANTLGVSTNGTERIRVSSTGLVGINTGSATPGGRLDVMDTNKDPTSGEFTAAVSSSTAQGIGVGGSLSFNGVYTGTSQVNFSGIKGAKENGNDNNTAGYLAIYTRPNGGAIAERARFNSTGAFVLAGGTTTASGIGIAFPATQSASTDANCLDDYEEGVWTPVYSPTTGSFTSITPSNTGYYVKIGRVVYIWGDIRTTGTTDLGTASGRLNITGLPFTVNNPLGGYGQVSVMQKWNLGTGTVNLGIVFDVGQSRLYFAKNSSNAAISYVQATELSTTTGNFESLMGFFGMYQI